MNSNRPLLSLPCKIQIHELDKGTDGYHCSSCDKVLTDFRGKPNDEILHTIRTSEQKVCGIFHPNQFAFKTSELVMPSTRRVGLSLLGILGFLGPILTSCSDEQPSPPEKDTSEVKQKAFNRLKFPMKVEGVLQDEATKKPLPFAEVAIYQDGKKIRSDQTDEKGNFFMVLEEGDLVRENFDFILSKTKYKTDTLKSWSMAKDAVGHKVRLTMRAETGRCVPTTVGFTPPVPGEPILEVDGLVEYEPPTAGVPIFEPEEPPMPVEKPDQL